MFQERKLKEQQLLFAEDSLLPVVLPSRESLQPAPNPSALFEECHNYIYANEGLLKEKIFHEFVKLLVMKLYDEQTQSEPLQFGITQNEYRLLLADKPSSFEKRIDLLYQIVRKKFSTLLTDERVKLKSLTLGHIVSRLQNVSLTRTPGDVKGEAFQTFTYRHQRGDRGEFFTPHPIVRLAVEMLDPQPNEMVIDPACGSG
ncbi:MAG: restriction endonuclease subunit M, partial [Chloroflexi bacterium UTCFX4]